MLLDNLSDVYMHDDICVFNRQLINLVTVDPVIWPSTQSFEPSTQSFELSTQSFELSTQSFEPSTHEH